MHTSSQPLPAYSSQLQCRETLKIIQLALNIVCSFRHAEALLWLLENLTARISWLLFQRKTKSLTSEAENFSVQELEVGQIKGADFQERFLHHECQAGFPTVASTGLWRASLQPDGVGLLWKLSPAGAAPYVQGLHSGCRQARRAATPGNSSWWDPPGQNNQNSLENLKLLRYVVLSEMKHSSYQPAT